MTKDLPAALEAYIMRQKGASYEEIATALGVTPRTARSLVSEGLEEITVDLKEGALSLLALQVGRLDEILKILWPEVEQGKYAAIDRAIRVVQTLLSAVGGYNHKTVLQQNNLLLGDQESVVQFQWPDGRKVMVGTSKGKKNDDKRGDDPIVIEA